MRLFPTMLLMAAWAAGTSQAAEPELASKLDYTLNGARDAPVVCKEGDIQRFPGMTLAQVFGQRWPVQPEPDAGSDRKPAQVARWVRDRSITRGAPVQPGIAVIAVLVDASGEPRRAEVLCATSAGYDNAAKRIAMRSAYKPAIINGQATTSVAVHPMKFGGGGG